MAFAGRQLRIRIGSTVVAGAQTDTITINREPINVTDKDNEGVQTLIAEQGTYAVEMSVEGVLEGTQLIDLVSDATPASPALTSMTILVSTLGSFAGDFFISSFELTGAEGAEAITFSATLMSSGEVPFTAA